MSIKCAFLFPGQGSQAVGMGQDFFNHSDIAKQMISDASTRTGIDFENLLFEEKFTLKQIQVFLEEDCNCKVAYSNLHAFCKRRFKSSSKDRP